MIEIMLQLLENCEGFANNEVIKVVMITVEVKARIIATLFIADGSYQLNYS